MRIGLGLGLCAGGGAPWNPSRLGSALRVWLRADTGIALNGATVSAWTDLSGNGLDCSQGVAGAQPTYQASDANFGGHPSLLFDGGDMLAGAGSVMSGSVSHAIFIAARVVTAPAVKGIVGVGADGGALHGISTIAMFTSGTNKWWWGTNDQATPLGSLPDTNPHILSKTYEHAGSNPMIGYVDGAQDATTNFGGSPPVITAGYVVGALSSVSNGANVEIAEVVILSGLPSAANRTTLTRYLGNRYGITVA